VNENLFDFTGYVGEKLFLKSSFTPIKSLKIERTSLGYVIVPF